MRILHVPYTYFPDVCGGTEVYVRALAMEQRKMGHDVQIAAPSPANCEYTESGFTVRRFAIAPELSLSDLYGEGDAEAAENFDQVLAAADPDLVHVHALTSAISGRAVAMAKRRGLPVVFTYHTPTVTCLRGSLLRFGRTVCSGRIEGRACAACTLHGAGLGELAAQAVARLPVPLTQLLAAPLGKMDRRLDTMFRMPGLVAARKRTLDDVFRQMDAIVAVCEWVKAVLLRNGVPAAKISVVRQGLAEMRDKEKADARIPGKPLRLIFLGRLSATKGILMFAQAFAATPAEATLDIHGVVQDREAREMREKLAALANSDARIRLLPALPSEDVVRRLSKYDCLVAPSQWLESGPLVVYEAFAAGVPVLGSGLGGIAELITDGVNGVLVPHDSPAAWSEAIRKLAAAPERLQSMRASLPPVRSMRDAACEMEPIYQSMVRCAA